MDEVEAYGAFQRWIGELKEVDDRGSVFLVVNASKQSKLTVRQGMLYGSSSS